MISLIEKEKEKKIGKKLSDLNIDYVKLYSILNLLQNS
jgi:hypothetical protein